MHIVEVCIGSRRYAGPLAGAVGVPQKADGVAVLARLDGVAASTGSACHTGHVELSPVLKAMGVAPKVGMGAIRFSLGRGTTRGEIDIVADQLADVLASAP